MSFSLSDITITVRHGSIGALRRRVRIAIDHHVERHLQLNYGRRAIRDPPRISGAIVCLAALIRENRFEVGAKGGAISRERRVVAGGEQLRSGDFNRLMVVQVDNHRDIIAERGGSDRKWHSPMMLADGFQAVVLRRHRPPRSYWDCEALSVLAIAS